ncbi:wax ester/triacylglycerol synthase family O-acyltransferase [Kribbella sp. NPDC020789]
MSLQQVDDLGAMYLAAENDHVSTHTAVLLTLRRPTRAGREITAGTLRGLVLERLPDLPAFRQRLAEVPFGLDRPYWIEADVDLDYHVREVALPAPGTDEQLHEQVAQIFARPLDRSRPLWEMYLIDGLSDGRQALLTKVHHAVADGRTGVRILGALTDDRARPRRRRTAPLPPAPPPPGSASMVLRGLAGALRQPFRALAGLPAALSGIDELPVVGALPGAGLLGAAVRLRHGSPHAAIARAPRTSFNQQISRHRCTGTADLSFRDVQLVKTHFAVSVNDVVMAISAGALRRWLLEHAELPDRRLTAVVPVSLRSPDSESLGNKLSAVVVPIPTDVADPAARLGVVHRIMLTAFRDLRSTAPDALTDTVRMVPPAFAVRTVQLLTRLNAWAPLTPATNVNISNVRGPQRPVYLAGTKVESMVPLAGITDGLGLNITVMSYNGRLFIGVVADPEQVRDVQRIAGWMVAELAALVSVVDRRKP